MAAQVYRCQTGIATLKWDASELELREIVFGVSIAKIISGCRYDR